MTPEEIRAYAAERGYNLGWTPVPGQPDLGEALMWRITDHPAGNSDSPILCLEITSPGADADHGLAMSILLNLRDLHDALFPELADDE